MGMDVFGKNPDAEVGEYWRSSIWSWPSVLDGIAATGVLDDDLILSMSFNDGAGPDAAKAVELADALVTLADDPDLDRLDEQGEVRRMPALMGKAFGLPDVQPQEDDAQLRQEWRRFAEFSRHSGGFQVC